MRTELSLILISPRHLLAMVIPLLLLISACDLISQEPYIPKNIKAYPNTEASIISWGGDTSKIVARINSLRIECIPIEIEQEKGSSRKIMYEIATTANVFFNIIDKKFFNSVTLYRDIEANIIFEALTANNVVLASAKGTLKIIKGGNSTTASAKIIGLTLEEIKRVTRVEARWEYGK
jgi:hypothetical protein